MLSLHPTATLTTGLGGHISLQPIKPPQKARLSVASWPSLLTKGQVPVGLACGLHVGTDLEGKQYLTTSIKQLLQASCRPDCSKQLDNQTDPKAKNSAADADADKPIVMDEKSKKGP